MQKYTIKIKVKLKPTAESPGRPSIKRVKNNIETSKKHKTTLIILLKNPHQYIEIKEIEIDNTAPAKNIIPILVIIK